MVKGCTLHTNKKLDNISVRETLFAAIYHAKRGAVERRVFRGALCMSGGADLVHKMFKVAKTRMSTLPTSGASSLT